MPVTNPDTLPAIAFSKNMLQLVLQSDDYLVAAAVKSINFLNFNTAIAEDTVFVLSWNAGTATMTAKDAPDDSGLQFPSGDGSNSYVTGLLDWFNGNAFLSRDYVITADISGAHPKLVFTAINNGPDYDFTSFNSGASGVDTNGVTDQPKTNFMHHLELWIAAADRSSYTKAFYANIPLDYPLTAKTTVDIHEALHAFLTSDYPELSAAYSICQNSIRPYYFRMAQFYGSIPFVRKLTKSATYYINKGGLSKKNALLRDIIAELAPGTDKTKWRFLRQGSKNKPVSPAQPEWLTWINFTGASQTISLELTIYNDDSSDSGPINVVAGVVTPSLQKLQFQAGFTQLDITSRQDLKNPIYYTLRIKGAAGYLTDTYTYVIDYTYRPWPRYFVYENSYGGFQTIGTVGKGINEYDRTKDDAQMEVNQHQAAIDGEFLEANILIQEKGTVNIGYDRSGRRNVILLRDFIVSRTKYVWDNGALVPIGLNTKNLKDAADGVNVYANSFEYYILNQDEVYTEDTGLADDDIGGLLGGAGSPIPPGTGGGGTGGTGTGDAIVVDFGDTHLDVDGDDHQTYTAAALVGLTGYAVFSTQLANYFRPAEISYDSAAGSFTILIDGFALENGEQLIISPYVMNPDA